ncbi:MAG: SUMF1/EgtB/PvdO family nonheme iron enzyme [Magnetococcales bacterium]|nr:SUMF1/EgtB/PvdO family nonheme iron enzyme [Magnetococcales bacterium]
MGRSKSKVFISYSREDNHILKSFIPFKNTLERDGLVVVWTDREIQTGKKWREEIKKALSEANTAILFISQTFLASEFIYNEELPPLLHAHLQRGLTILPVFVSPFDEDAAKIPFQDPDTQEKKIIDLASFQGYATPDHTLEHRTSLEQKGIFRALAKRIRELSAPRPPDPPITDLLPGLRMLPVPGGVFTMGNDQSVYENEKPAHQVELSPFHLAETPVTNQQYRRFLEENPNYQAPKYWKDKRFSNDQQPVVGVDWNDAIKFCEWLSEASKKEFFLPTEAQWEYAARGTKGRRFPWGNDDPTPKHACFGLDRGTGKPALVGQYPAGRGPFGHLDLAGNVWEWCRDVWDADAYKKRAALLVKNPLVTVGERGWCSVRGGSWVFPASDLRAAVRRGGDGAGDRLVNLGFRLAAPASLGS